MSKILRLESVDCPSPYSGERYLRLEPSSCSTHKTHRIWAPDSQIQWSRPGPCTCLVLSVVLCGLRLFLTCGNYKCHTSRNGTFRSLGTSHLFPIWRPREPCCCSECERGRRWTSSEGRVCRNSQAGQVLDPAFWILAILALGAFYTLYEVQTLVKAAIRELP